MVKRSVAKSEKIKILAIETSCDETSAAIIGVENDQPVILSNVISSSVELYSETGGIVPEIASRAQMEFIVPVIQKALKDADFELSDITHIAVTAGPGLIGSLLIGFNAAKTLAYAKDLPIIPINHIEGHVYSAFRRELSISNYQFPILILTVSGGHTMLVLMKNHGKYEILGGTIDDAVGEAYDKVARLLGLGYPGGPAISRLASNFRSQGKKAEIKFPRPIMNDGSFNFSFSGLKTAVLVETKRICAAEKLNSATEIKLATKEEIAFAFEDAVADVLSFKLAKAVEKYSPKAAIFAGGVSANKYLVESIKYKVISIDEKIRFLTPDSGLTGDNAAMIGLAAYYHIKRGDVSDWRSVKVDSNLKLVN